MNQERQEAYLNLIQQLLDCQSWEEPEILRANQELLDAGFLQVLKTAAQMYWQEGQENTANWLINLGNQLVEAFNLSPEVNEEQNLESLSESNFQIYWQFLLQVLQATRESNGDAQVVYPLLAANTDKLNLILAEILCDLISATLEEVQADTVQSIVVDIVNFSILIQQFPFGKQASNMEIAITGYEIALTITTREAFPVDWAMTQYNLGNAYFYRILGEKADNIEQALAAYHEALTIRTREAFPVEWATTQNNLGNAYLYRILGEKAGNIENAIAAFNAALTVRTREAFPVNWAGAQNNLGAAYTDRILGEKADNIEQAIAAYHAALTVTTCEAFPVNWAMTQNNLGNAYSNRILGEKADNIENAIAAFNAALTITTCDTFPVEWAMTQNNLGTAYNERILGEKADNIENAIAAYHEALTIKTREAFPVNWAMTQHNLGAAYSDRILGEKANNIEQAIAAYHAALNIYTREAFPVDWAMTQNNLGNAYSDRILGEKTDNIEKAIAAYHVALTIKTRDAFPQDNAETLANLGLLYYNEKQFLAAYDTFVQAIETVESLRGEIVSGDESKRKQAEEWNRLYRRMIQTCLELGFNDQAIEYSDRSKTRNLVELLATNNLYPKGKIPPQQRQEMQQLRREIATENRRLATDSQPDYTHINQLRQRYNELYPFEPIRFHQIQALLDGNTAIIQWYIFDDCFRAFIITHDNSIIWKSSQLALENLENWIDEYLQTYIAIKQADPESAEQKDLQNQWQDSLDLGLQDLAEILHINEILAQLPGTINQLIFIPHLYLHLLPLHSLPVSPEIWQHFHQKSSPPPSHPYLLDCFNNGVRYAPSCQLLQQLQQQQRPKFERLFAIQTPTEDLYEQDLGSVAAIKKQFPDSPCILKQSQAKKSAILNIDENTNTTTIHEKLLASHSAFFFCHGYFNFNSPLDSGLQLADETLTLAEIIEHFDLKTCRLVTLSACETGLIDFDNMSDEYIGLPNGFLLAGSTNVVSSLWTVSSVATAFLMIKFYEELQQQTNIALALNTAQRWLRDTTVQGFLTWLGNSQLSEDWQEVLIERFNQTPAEKRPTVKPFEQPYYWAAFCTIGKGV